ncbi:MAG: hypothetical protein ACRDT6_13190 [Micromonosporaceae bacterium]
MTVAFDTNTYRKTVLARLLNEPGLADPYTGDPFLVCAVDPDADDATVRGQLDEVVAFWNKERNHPRYRGLVARLVSRKQDYSKVLLSSGARRAAADRVGGERRAALEEGLSVLDELARRVVADRGGVPRSRVEALRRIATNHGLDNATFESWVARQHVLEDSQGEPWDASVRHQIRRTLDELGAVTDDPQRFASLYTVLGLTDDAPSELVKLAAGELSKLNAGGRRDRRKTLLGEVLATIRTRLLATGGRERYAASLRADAYELILPEVEMLAVVTGEISPDDHQTLVAVLAGKGWGLSVVDAREIIRRVAAATGASVQVSAAAAEIIVCPVCGKPQSALTDECRYCSAELYLSCPGCHTRQPAAASVCPKCRTSFAAAREVLSRLAAAHRELAAGRPVSAMSELDVAATAARQAGSGTPPRALADARGAAQQTILDARSGWQDVAALREEHKLFAARDTARRLVRVAADVPAADDRSAADVLAELETAADEVLAEVTAAREDSPAGAERRLLDVLRRWPDAAAAQDALARLPLAAPTGIRAIVATDAVELHWEPSSSLGDVGYRLTREVTAAGQQSSHGLGSTTSTYFEDAGAPAGMPVRYHVTAISGSRASEPVLSDEVLLTREVEGLAARTVRGGDGRPELHITARAMAGSGVVVAERLGPDGEPVGEPLRADPDGVVRDTGVTGGQAYTYRARMEYQGAGEPVRTEGRLLETTVDQIPVPVSELWFTAQPDGGVRLSFDSPPAGEVRVYASDGPDGAPVATAGTEIELPSLSGLRLVGGGTRRVIDRMARGRAVYTAVTVVGGLAVAGASLPLIVAPPVVGLRVLADDRATVRIGFQMPIGVTEAAVRWRRDGFPVAADDPAAEGTNVTNTKLEIDGGLSILAPDDGRPLYVAVYPTVRLTPSGRPVPASVTSTLLARAGR